MSGRDSSGRRAGACTLRARAPLAWPWLVPMTADARARDRAAAGLVGVLIGGRLGVEVGREVERVAVHAESVRSLRSAGVWEVGHPVRAHAFRVPHERLLHRRAGP